MLQTFRSKRFDDHKMQLIDNCNEVVDTYMADGFRLTLRQLYYQLVTRNTIVNSDKSYKSLGRLVSEGRLAGLIDWDAIEDRVRVPRAKPEWPSIPGFIKSVTEQYRLPRWGGQDKYVELWVEKDALAGVLWPIAARNHITLMVNRGYSSQSAMYEAANRLRGETLTDDEPNGRMPVVLYLGDHDPSGEDMVRDIRDRFEMFGIDVYVHKVALTTKQVKQFDPPPNPAKVTDSRAKAYIAKHGPVSWEVDALPPKELTRIIESAIGALVDQDKVDTIIAQENRDKVKMRAATAKL